MVCPGVEITTPGLCVLHISLVAWARAGAGLRKMMTTAARQMQATLWLAGELIAVSFEVHGSPRSRNPARSFGTIRPIES
jgi:hypothetical protein